MRDGQSALVSKKPNSIVLVRPANRQFSSGGRPVFIVAIANTTKQPQDFRVSDVSVMQNVNGENAALKVITYEELVNEEKTRQVIAALGTGLAAAGNSMSASQAGYYNANSTVYTPRGTYLVNTSGYSPTAAAIAQSNANAQNAAMIDATIARGQANMATLAREVIKDNTLLPGEWYGGQLWVQPPIDQSGRPKNYSISLQVGPDRHDITVVQGAAQ